jgi:hypothetical protein
MRGRFHIPFTLSLCLVGFGCDFFSSSQAPTEEKSANALEYEAAWADRVAKYEAAVDDEARVMALAGAMTFWLDNRSAINVYTMQEFDIASWRTYLIEKANAELERIGPQVPTAFDPTLVDVPQRPTHLTRALHYVLVNASMYYFGEVENRPPAEAMRPHLLSMLADDAPYDTRESVSSMVLEAVAIYDKAYGRKATHQVCAAALEQLDPDSALARVKTIWCCQDAVGPSWRTDLAEWATPKDIAEFDKEWAGRLDAMVEAQYHATNAELDRLEQQRKSREAEADAASSDASASDSSGSSDAAAGSSSVSYTIKNSCGASVKLAFADGDPKFKSSSTLGLSANQQTRNSSKPGQQIWIVDGSGNGIASTSVSGSTQTVEITGSSCNSISAR